MDALRGGASTSAARETVVFWDFEGLLRLRRSAAATASPSQLGRAICTVLMLTNSRIP
jgi:hypothetical protein